MLFYMQMRNWFLIFMLLTIAYMIHQRLHPNSPTHLLGPNVARAAVSFSIFK